MKITYEIGSPQKDGTQLLYGFTLPNCYSMDEQEDTEVMFRWAERIAAIQAPVTASPCHSMALKVSSVRPQKVELFLLHGSDRSRIGFVEISGEKKWKENPVTLKAPIQFEAGNRIELIADKEYLGMWRQNCYRLSTVSFDFQEDSPYDFGYEEFRREPAADEYQLLIGDPHVHTNASLCFRDIDFGSFQRNIDRALKKELDFISFTDHPEHFLHYDLWDKFVAVFEQYNQPPFIILPAYEWASKSFGNYNIYFDGIPRFESVVHPWEQRGNSLKKLWAACRLSECRFMTVPHHTYHPFLPVYNSCPVPSELQSAVEIFSNWGSSESFEPEPWHNLWLEPGYTLNPGFYAEDMLRRGMKMGFLGGTDAHNNWAGDAGLTGLFVKDFSVKGIFDAILARRTYATTGIKLKLDMTVNGYPMGHVFSVNQYTVNVVFPLHFVLNINGTSPITRVELVANGAVIRTENFSDGKHQRRVELEVERGTRELADTNRYYYIRIYQEEGSRVHGHQGMAWTSPVWIDYEFVENEIGDGQNRCFIDVEEHLMVPLVKKGGMQGRPREKLLDI